MQDHQLGTEAQHQVKEVGIQVNRLLPAEKSEVGLGEVEQLQATIRQMDSKMKDLNSDYEINKRELQENSNWLENQDNLVSGIKRLELENA